MKGSLIANNINQIKVLVKNSKILKESKKEKYIKELELLHTKYLEVEIKEEFKTQHNQMNTKGVQLIKEIKESKDRQSIEGSIEVYTRYLKASIGDFEGKTINLRKYITSFLFCAMLFLALTPQFYGFILPVLFFIPIYIGLKGVKQRTMTGFYMTMSVVPVAIMTSITWIRYGLNVKTNYNEALKAIIDSGISQNLAEILIVVGPLLGCILLMFAIMQLYRGVKSKDLFI